MLGFEILDKDGSEMKRVCFGDAAVRFSQELRQGAVYEISKGQVTQARNPRFAISQYEIKVDQNTTFVLRAPRRKKPSRGSSTISRRLAL